jgi:alpha-glucosidase
VSGRSESWWQEGVVYQVYIRSFADADGDGVGDLRGITSRLPYLRDLGVDALWITPFYRSPQKDHGYDVADYTDIDPLFGTLDDADELLARAHELDLRVIVDLVPNHTSDQHAWFQEALAAGPGSPERSRYLFRDGKGPDGEEPPNNWESIFGGPAWTRAPDGQWWLHLFDPTQPDLDWRNPEVGDMFEDVLRFWLDRGVDGFRVDVAHGLYKEESLRDQDRTTLASGCSRTSRCGSSRRCTTSTGAGAACSTSTATSGATGSASPRPGPRPPSRWRSSCAATSCTRRSTSLGSPPTGRRAASPP